MHRRVARVLRDVDGLVVPAVKSELCSEGVFVAELLDGQTVDGARPKAAARVLVGAHLAAARAGIALLDARPGHVVELADGRIGLLGVGVGRPVDRARAVPTLDAYPSALELLRRGQVNIEAAQDIWLARSAAHLAATVAATS